MWLVFTGSSKHFRQISSASLGQFAPIPECSCHKASDRLHIPTTGRLFSEFEWGHPSRRRVETSLIIMYSPDFDFTPRILQRHEPVIVLSFLSQPAIEWLHRSIICWCSRSVEVNTDIPFIYPPVQRFPCKFRAIIHFRQLRQGPSKSNTIQNFHKFYWTQVLPDTAPQTFADIQLDNRQQAQHSTIKQLIKDHLYPRCSLGEFFMLRQTVLSRFIVS